MLFSLEDLTMHVRSKVITAPLLSEKPLSSPMSSLYTMQQHMSIVSLLPAIWTSVSEAIKYHLNSLDVSNESIFIPPIVSCKSIPGHEYILYFCFESICLLKERARFKIRIQTKKNEKCNTFLCRKKYNINQLGLNIVRWQIFSIIILNYFEVYINC